MTDTIRMTFIAACLAAALPSPAHAQAPGRGASQAADSKDAAELKAYRLSLPMLNKIDVATKAFATTIKTDPRYKELTAAQKEYDGMKEKDDPSPAERARMAELKKKLDASPFRGPDDDDASLDAVEAGIKSMPPMMNALTANGVAPREYGKFLTVLIQSYMASMVPQATAQATQSRDPNAQIGAGLAAGLAGMMSANVAPENVAWARTNRAAIERFMQTMQALEERQ
jgi:hypothetical protein